MKPKQKTEPAAVLPPEDNTHIGKVIAPPPKPTGALKIVFITVSVLFVVLMLAVYAMRQKLILDPVARFLTKLFFNHKKTMP